MARKKMQEPERWITVNGQHLPVYPGGIIGQPGQTPPAKESKSKTPAVNDKGTMSPKKLSDAEDRRDELWDKEDKGTITPAEKKELDKLEKSISGHYTEKKNQMAGKKINASYNDVKDLPKKLPEGHEYAIYNKTRGEFEGKGTYSSKNPEDVVTREGTTSYGFRGSNTVAKEFERRKQISPDDEYQIVAIKKGPARSEAENAKIREEAARQRQYAEANAAEKKNQTSPKTNHSTVADTVQQNVDALNDFHDKAWKYGADRDALKTLIRQRANEMPDGTVLARVKQETSSQYTSKGIIQQTETKMSKLYKINGQWSRYKDGSGKIDDIASEVIHGSGKLQTLESAKQQAAKLQETDEIKTRGYGIKERFTSTKDNDVQSAPRTTSRNARYDTSRATTKSSNLNNMSVSELRAMAKKYGVSQKTISSYDADELRMILTGLLNKK